MDWLYLIRRILCRECQEDLENARAEIYLQKDMIDTLEEKIDDLMLGKSYAYMPNPDPDRDVLDGLYTGEMTIEDIIEQFEYRGGIHLTYIELNKTDLSYEAYGTTKYHLWAINGYSEAIKHLEGI